MVYAKELRLSVTSNGRELGSSNVCIPDMFFFCREGIGIYPLKVKQFSTNLV